MGNWRVELEGHGQHDNRQPNDIEALIAELVAKLKGSGHQVHRARVVAGGWQDCTHPGFQDIQAP